MKRIIFLIFIFQLFSCKNSSTEFVVKLKSNDGYAMFMPGNVILWPTNDSIHYRNFPNDINEFVVRSLPMQKDQYYWNQYLNKKIDKETFTRIAEYYKIDTTKLTNAYVDCEVLFLIGTRMNKRVIIVDSDNDEDFGNEKILEYDYPINNDKKKEIELNLPVILTHYEYFEDNTVKTKTVNIKPSPYKGSLGITFNTENEIEKKYYLFASFPEYKKGTITLNKIDCEIYLSNSFCSNIYEKNTTKLFIIPKSQSKPSEFDGDIPNEIGDIFNIQGHDYLIDSVSKWGTDLFLKYVGDNIYPSGVTEGFYIPKFQAKQLDNSIFTLEQYSGKYILLDFWGTWCNPCIKFIPELQKLNADFKEKNFVLVSVAYDSDINKVIDFVTNEKMNWIHLFVDQNNSDKNSIVKKLKITSYPSTILLSPSGEIIARNRKIEELRKLLDEKLITL